MSIFGEVESGQLLATKPALATEHASLRNPQKFQNIHRFAKVLVDTTRGRAKRKGDSQKL